MASHEHGTPRQREAGASTTVAEPKTPREGAAVTFAQEEQLKESSVSPGRTPRDKRRRGPGEAAGDISLQSTGSLTARSGRSSRSARSGKRSPDADLSGFTFATPKTGHRVSAPDWLYAASRAHAMLLEEEKDHEDRGLAHYKDTRVTACSRMFWLAMFGVFTAVWSNELVYAHGHHSSMQSLSLKLATVVSSGAAIYYLLLFYHAEICILRLKGWRLEHGLSIKSLHGANLYNAFIRDLCILLPMPLPYLDFEFSVHDSGLGRDSTYPFSVILLSLMFTRIFFLPRYHSYCVRNLHTDEHDVLFAMNTTRVDDAFLLKSAMTTSLSAVISVFILQIMLFSYMLMMFERPTAAGALKTWANSAWVTVVTMTTVGYGDIYPTTRMGRLVAIANSITAMMMIAVAVNLVQNSTVLNRSEHKVVRAVEKRRLEQDYEHSAGLVILRSLKVFVERKRAARNKVPLVPIRIEELSYKPPLAVTEGMGVPRDDDGAGDQPPYQLADQLEGQSPPAQSMVGSSPGAQEPSAVGVLPQIERETLQEEGEEEEQQAEEGRVVFEDGVAVMYGQEGRRVPGGGRGRARVAEIYGEQLAEEVLLAEEMWHLALQKFRDARRQLTVYEMAQSSDAITAIHELEHDLGNTAALLDDAEAKLAATIRLLQRLLAHVKASQGSSGGGVQR